MRLQFGLVFTALACACAPTSTTTSNAPPPGLPMQLQVSPLEPGGAAEILVQGAPRNARVELYRSSGELGAGDCPSFLAGACFDMLPGPYRRTLRSQTDRWGTARWYIPSVPLQAGDALSLQAVAYGTSGVELSNPLGVVVDACWTDSMEDNDAYGDAQRLDAPFDEPMSLCIDDPDYFWFDLWDGPYRVEITWDPADGDLDPHMTRAHTVTLPGRFIATLASGSPRLSLMHPEGASPRGFDYHLRMDVESIDGGPCNHATRADESSALLLAAGTVVDTFCGTEAWYEIDVSTAADIRIDAADDAGRDYLNYDLFYDGELVQADVDGEDVAVSEGPLFLRVTVAETEWPVDPFAQGVIHSLDVVVSPLAPCVDPGDLEPDDGPTTASTIVSGRIDGAVCAGSEDWMVVDAVMGDQLRIRRDDEPLVFVDLYGPDELLIEEDVTLYDVVADGPHYLRTRVLNTPAGEAGDYGFEFAHVRPTDCVADAFSPNQTSETAALITDAGQGVACLLESDWFAVDVGTPEDIVANIDTDAVLTTRVFGPDGVLLVESNDAQVPFEAGTAGRYLMEISGFSYADATAPYTLDLQRTEYPCAPADGLEPNDSMRQTTPIADGSVMDANACMWDEDWYELPLMPVHDLVAELGYDTLGGTVQLEMDLLNAVGTVTRTADDPNATGMLRIGAYTFLLQNRWFLRVRNVSRTDVPYTLDVSLTPRP